MNEENDFNLMEEEFGWGDTLFGFDDICSEPIEIISDTNFPETGGMSLISTGTRGGDSSHGGKAKITFFTSECDYIHPKVSVIYSDGSSETLIDHHLGGIRDVVSLSISVAGDWELQGFIANLLNIANQLLSERKNNREAYIEEKTYEIFNHIEPALKQAIAEALK